jgi:uncharacterized protein (TIGR04141 family)
MPRRRSTEPKTRTFTVFLLKDDSPGRPIKSAVACAEHAVRFDQGEDGALFIQRSDERPPSWLSFFAGSVPSLTGRILNTNTSAVLVLKRQRKRFAIVFGYGRHLLEPGSWEEDFGLRTTLNSVDRKRIRSIDRMSLDAIGQHSQIQASREADINEFGLDLEQDLLRAVTGSPYPALGMGKRLTGKDALQITTNINLNDLPPLLDILLVQWRKEDYKATYPWIDQIQELKDANKKAELDNLLVEKIKRGDLERLWLTIPQIIDWSVVEGFKYRHAADAPIHGDVHLNTFREQLRDLQGLTADDLRHQYVIAMSHEGENEIDAWPIYRCLYCEIDQGSDTYLLTNGHWYKVGTAFLQRVTEARNFLTLSRIKWAMRFMSRNLAAGIAMPKC